MPRTAAVLVIALLVGTAGLPAGAAAIPADQSGGYAGTHVEFGTASNAVVDYTVGGETMLRSVAIQSESTTRTRGNVRVDAGLSAVTQLPGAALSLDSTTDVSATVTAESGAEMQAHDNPRGVFVVRAGSEPQYVTVNVSESSQADSESDRRVVVTTDDGTEGTFVVVGDGEVTVNEQGNVTAKLGSEGALVFRSYPEGRDDEDEQQERLIADGTAAAEVYVMESSERSGDLAADVVRYSEDTTVEVTEKSEGTVRMTAERSQEEGRIVITSVTDRAISSLESLQVTVDGDAAAKASSYGDLESALGGDTSKFLVRQKSSAEASGEVLVAVNHFSERDIEMRSGDDGSENGSGTDGGTSGTTGPGFGVGVTLAALVVAALAAYRRG